MFSIAIDSSRTAFRSTGIIDEVSIGSLQTEGKELQGIASIGVVLVVILNESGIVDSINSIGRLPKAVLDVLEDHQDMVHLGCEVAASDLQRRVRAWLLQRQRPVGLCSQLRLRVRATRGDHFHRP